MAARHRLTLVAPALLGPVPETLRDAVAELEPLSGLRAMLARAGRARMPGGDTETLLQAWTAGDWSPGGVARAATGASDTGGIWYRAAPVHLRADRDRLLLFAGAALYPDAGDAEALAETFNGLYHRDGLELVAAGGNWLLGARERPGPDLPPLAAVAGQYLDTRLPSDAATRPWRRLLNEVQMLFHDHPVNQRREAAGLPAVNGLWFWGGGETPASVPLPVDAVHGVHPLARGLACLAGAETLPPPGTLADLAADRSRLVVADAAEQALLGGDAGDWLGALGRFESALAAPLMTGGQRAWAVVELLPGNGLCYRLDWRSRWRLWRRQRPLRAWIATS